VCFSAVLLVHSELQLSPLPSFLCLWKLIQLIAASSGPFLTPHPLVFSWHYTMMLASMGCFVQSFHSVCVHFSLEVAVTVQLKASVSNHPSFQPLCMHNLGCIAALLGSLFQLEVFGP